MGRYCPGHAGVKRNDWTDRLAGKATLLTASQWLAASRKISVEELGDTTCGHKAKDITPLVAWRREALKKEAIGDLPRKDESRPSGQSDGHWNRYRSNVGETSERRGGARNYGLFPAHIYHLELNWTELNPNREDTMQVSGVTIATDTGTRPRDGKAGPATPTTRTVRSPPSVSPPPPPLPRVVKARVSAELRSCVKVEVAVLGSRP